MKRKLVMTIIDLLNKFFLLIYALALTNEKIPFMVDKSVFIQFAPIAVSFVIAIICEAYFADDDND